MLNFLNLPGVEYFRGYEEGWVSCTVTRYNKSSNSYNIRFGVRGKANRVPADRLGIKWSLLSEHRKSQARKK